MALNLLEKTELWINKITLNQANLTEIANTVADVLGLEHDKVLVVDVRPNHITLDIIEKDIPQENLLGREEEILASLGTLPGVTLEADCYIHSNGILGLICADIKDPDEMLTLVDQMTADIRQHVLRRAMIFPTGFELQQGLIKDTNTPFLKALLEQEGYTVTIGEIMSDNLQDIHSKLSDALNRGFGLIVTTGGVGAEDKDFAVEGICSVAPEAATPYIVKFQQGTGRHKKDGVRIGVGTVGLSTLISLPGPHDEVILAAPVVVNGLREQWSQEQLAEQLAFVLAEKWRRPHHRHTAEHKHN